jgi:prolipoprotein diacylglyceryltransferase
MLAAVWPLRRRFRRSGSLLWTVIALYGVGRFVMFFWRSDSDTLALSLSTAQWTSLVLLTLAGTGLLVARARRPRGAGTRLGPVARSPR